MNERTLDVYLAEPRGFCTGVRRAVGIVEEALKQYGAPVFVRHEIVHNKFVIENLRAKGAVFIDELAGVGSCFRHTGSDGTFPKKPNAAA